MGTRILRRWLSSGSVVLTLLAGPAHGLIRFNEGRDQIFVIGTLSVGYDSNIYASSVGEGDVVTNVTLAVEYTRRAGMIGVNGTAAWNLGSFASNGSENFSSPSLSMELVKDSGRTTGSFTFGVSQQSQADPVVNQRIESWNFNTGLNWKYPVIDRYSLSGNFGYSWIDYTDNGTGLVDLDLYTAGIDLLYAYTTQRDLIAGYNIRRSESSSGIGTTDHAFTVGVSGKIYSKLNGTVRVGYMLREVDTTGETFDSYTTSASVTWPINKRFSITGTASKDFSTSATDSSMDVLRGNLDAQYFIRNRWSLYAGVGGGYIEFLNGVDNGREDYYFTWSLGLNYNLNDHFKAALTYSYFRNWSNRSTSDFDRNSITLSITSRW